MARRRALLSGLFSRKSPAAPAEDTMNPFERPTRLEPEEPDALSLALAEIEAGALEIYAQAGLPTQPGHYRRDPDTGDWVFIARHIEPSERFALALRYPPEQGWRFARLEDLGARSDHEDVQAAARLMGDVATLRASRRTVLTQEHLLTAMELGAAWRALRDAQAFRTSRLTLSVPEPARPKALKGDKPQKPR
ncbi:hypothetical protein HNP47_002402 [Brevundimonas vesicularis]|uniref:Uncharacterized protein n=1 Tax=Brevundimonas vesicularis TaxID=41276 RepID=A0A7W9FVT7_BREVE|nr:hypothetical protein [Brevundimonas vesicularis]MBB5772386.1 hypothetical protein [Brevundimonas vesicularis]